MRVCRTLCGLVVLVCAGCSHVPLPSLRLSGRLGLDLAQRRHATYLAQAELAFRARGARSAPAPGGPARVDLPRASAGELLCRYLRHAELEALSTLLEAP